MARPDPPSPPARLAAVLAAPHEAARQGAGAYGPVDAGRAWNAGQAGEPPTMPVPLAGPVEPHPPPDDRRAGGALRRLLPAGWQGARIDPGRPGATALALIAAAAAVVAAIGVWVERPRAEPVGAPPGLAVVSDEAAGEPPGQQVADPIVAGPIAAGPPAGAEPGAPADPAPAAGAGLPQPSVPLVVSVSGRVQRPGLVEVPAGARVADVLHAAGGVLPGTDLAGVNLARRVVDGEQVAVGVPPAPDAVPAAGAGGPVPPGPARPGVPPGRVDLNAATVEQLDVLPGVGPVTAQRIIEWRTRHGRFARVEQLREIEGIGERRFAQLRELVKV
ncbi:ComEA family DNA-binding protein [Pseudonocardia alaniniphila]|uniref:ComEA family DNA-binding protein n=1 Tax=Pseudonocardia alaniniphila TaxID=75291 RepID=A0ABS9TFS6_9PSEU|nr:ComEA family DNA-binding protein [Pseudonocardia alaniniphila]MCH6167392.1 ComEA family DNA-binding protein [Pseudonocardia alaniniphila]